MLEELTQGSMIALKRVARYLKGMRRFVNKLKLDTDIDKHVTRLDGFSDVTIEWRTFRGYVSQFLPQSTKIACSQESMQPAQEN